MGALYFSQQCVFRLAPQAGIQLPSNLSDAEKLLFVQEGALKIWQIMGTYLGYGIAHYADFYAIKRVLILGRCTSGRGGDLLMEAAKQVLQVEFPALDELLKGSTMNFHLPTAEVYIPDELPLEQALARTTHLCIAAHQDDIEIMAAQPILECFQQQDKWFTGVVVTDGRGSPRDNLYRDYTDEEMRLVRFKEQRKAAFIGEYAAQFMLDLPSKIVKDASRSETVEDLLTILRATRPQLVFTHNLADKHDTHVGVALRVVEALRKLEPAEHPERLVGCEVWRALDWMVDTAKVTMDVSEHENLQEALVGVFDSQIAGGKRYDLASMGRRRANATYFESHGVDMTTGLSYGMDMTPLINDASLNPSDYVGSLIQSFAQDVLARLKRMSRAGFQPAE